MMVLRLISMYQCMHTYTYIHCKRGVLFCLIENIAIIVCRVNFFPLSANAVKPFSVDIASDQDFRQCLLLYMLLLLLLLRTAYI